MHNVLKRVFKYKVKLLLLHCIKVGYFDLKLLNSCRLSQISVATLCAADNIFEAIRYE